jgi:30S ribosomal protein S31
MGRGDIKTKKGKISSGSYGVLRPHRKPKPVAVAKPKAKKVAPKKAEDDKPAAKKTSAKKKTE